MLEPPRLHDLDSWEGCFISSTSRLLLPVDEASILQVDATALGVAASASTNGNAGDSLSNGSSNGSSGSGPQAAVVRKFEQGGLVQRLEQLVLAEVAACSEPLLP